MSFKVNKKYGHELGLSCTYRQHRASSHCRQLHGYALSFDIEFESDELNENGWVIDFGSLAPIRRFLDSTFDHVTLVAASDPMISTFRELDAADLISLQIVPAVGCESFAEMVGSSVTSYLLHRNYPNKPRVASVTVSEHGSNSATWVNDNDK